MTDPSKLDRFEELDAGRVLGDLDAAEWAEWNALAAELGRGADPGLDLLAAGLETALGKPAPMPEGLAEKLHARLAAPENVAPFSAAGGEISEQPRVTLLPSRPEPHGSPDRRRSFLPGWVGWSLAAVLMGVLALRPGLPKPRMKPEEKRLSLVQTAPDLLKAGFAGTTGDYASASGEVVWSDARQEGYMLLDHLPVNDGKRQQYQLWIVDPGRDEIPVDGGVFDIPAGGGPVVVPVVAKLAVKHPAAFVITLEKPGGVVRSKQEVVVAIAKS